MKRTENSNQDLLDMIAALLKQIEGKDEMISVILEQNNELQHTISNLESTVAKLNDQIATMQRSLYGVKSEKSQNIKKDDNNKGNGGVGCNNLSDEKSLLNKNRTRVLPVVITIQSNLPRLLQSSHLRKR